MALFLIERNGPRFFFEVCIYFLFSACQLFLVSGYVGVEDSSFLMKGTFSFLTGTLLVPVEIELVPGFDLLSSPPSGLAFCFWFIMPPYS